MQVTSTQIQLIGDFYFPTTLPHGGINAFLELTEPVDVPLNFAISDIRDFTKKTGTFSKSIKVPGTKANNLTIQHYFDVNIYIDPDVNTIFNLNKKQKCCIMQDGQVILDNCIIQLIDVEKIDMGRNADEQISYTFLIKDTVGDLFTEMGNKLLTDLDFSDMNHEFTFGAVQYAWDYNDADNGGWNYLIPWSEDNVYNVEEFRPGIYAKRYLDRIFASNGYTYKWYEMDDDNVQFRKLFIPYNGDKPKIDEATQAGLTVLAENNSTQTSSGPEVTINYLDIPTEISDPNGDWDPSISVYTAPIAYQNGNSVNFTVTVDWEIQITNSFGVPVVYGYPNNYQGGTPQFYIVPKIQVKDYAQTTTYNSGVLTPTLLDSRVTIDGDKLRIKWDDINANPIPVGTTDFASGTSITTISCTDIPIGQPLILFAAAQPLNQYGELVGTWADASDWTITTSTGVTVTYKINSIKMKVVPAGDTVGPYTPLVMNSYVPKNVKQAEFVKSLFTMFNLYAVPSEDNPTEILLKTRDMYYDEGKVVNWDKKLNKNLAHTVTFLPDLTCKRLFFSYKEDKDTWNVGFKNNTGEVYGQVRWIFDNEYVKNDVLKEVSFGPSPFMKTEFGATCLLLNGAEPKTNMRIVYDGGMFNCGTYVINQNGGTLTMSQYRFFGHFDHPTTPALDLNWALCDYYYDSSILQFGSTFITANNLSNLWWRRTVSQINTGKLYTVYLDLDSRDISRLKLNDKIFLDGTYWNINKIIDYNANKPGPTKVELISVDEGTQLLNTPLTSPFDGDLTGIIKNPKDGFLNARYNSTNLVTALGRVELFGKNNVIQREVKSAIVMKDNGTITESGLWLQDAFMSTSGKIYNNNGDIISGSEIGRIVDDGIIIDTWNQGGRKMGLLMALEDIGFRLKYSDITTGIGASAQNYYDGRPNTEAIMAQGASEGAAYEASLWLDHRWYLPSAYEMQKIMNQKTMIYQVLEPLAGAEPLVVGYAYWTSTEDPYNVNNGLTYNTESATSVSVYKTDFDWSGNAILARAVRTIML